MKIITLITTFLILILPSIVFAGQMGSGSQSGSQQMMQMDRSSQMMQSQTANKEMMRNMSRVMEQMNTMMQDMSRVSSRDQAMNQDRRREMASIMEHVADGLHDMAKHMHEGTLNEQTRMSLQKQIDEMNQQMRKMQANVNPN